MKYLGLDVHSASTVWCLVDTEGNVLAEGSTPTTIPELSKLAQKLAAEDSLTVGQEVGTMAYLVRDAMESVDIPLLSFNAYHLRMIAASRKKTDRRDAYWIARALQTKLHPHPVYLPSGEVHALRQILSLRASLHRDRLRWQLRARGTLRAAGIRTRTGAHYLRKLMELVEERPEGVDASVVTSVQLCQRQEARLQEELLHIESQLRDMTKNIDAVQRLMTIPGVGLLVASTIYAWVGDVHRFPNAKSLASYAGLVPSVRQSGDQSRYGALTKAGSRALRSALVQSAHVAVSRCKTKDAEPIQALFERIRGGRGRRKIAICAVARNLLRISYYILRDETTYQPERMSAGERSAA